MLSGDKYFPIMLPYISIYTHTLSCIHTHDKGGKSSRLSAPCRKSRKMSLRQVEKFAFKRQGKGKQVSRNQCELSSPWQDCLVVYSRLWWLVFVCHWKLFSCSNLPWNISWRYGRESSATISVDLLLTDNLKIKPADRLQLQSRSWVERPFKLFISLEMYLFS